MLGSSAGDGVTSAHDGGGETVVGSSSSSSIMAAGNANAGDNEKGGGELYESGGGGNRWPRQETLALLKIRFDMDTVFRDSSLKGPLWEEVSRKMADLGYHRRGRKCKEKFENVYKYHKRTKEGRTGKSDGKTYRFFEQLEALEQHHSNSNASALPPLPPPAAVAPPRGQPQAAVPVTMVMPAGATVPSSPQPINVVHVSQHHQNVSSSNNTTVTAVANQMAKPQPQAQAQVQVPAMPAMIPTHPSPIQMEHSAPSDSPSATQSSSSSTSSDEEMLGRSRKRKRKWKDFFERLMKEVIDKQEDLQKRFLEAVEKRERDRTAQEEAWKVQEVARLNREHDILVQERSMAAAKDAALISLLQKLSEQQQIPLQLPTQLPSNPNPYPHQQPISQRQQVVVTSTTTTGTQPQQPPQAAAQVHHNPIPMAPPPPPPPPLPQPLPQPQPLTQVAPIQTQLAVDLHKTNNSNGGGEVQNPLPPSSSRWPKAEVQALINLRTNMDQKYQENGPKGPLWEEISGAMKKLGYNRNSKRCKEKWENINKYFKKVKESNKKRPEDAKTCPYFHQLDALYREKNKADPTTTTITSSYGHPSSNVNLGPIQAQPQQQWPNPGDPDSEEDGDEDEDDEDDQGSGYEIVANNAAGNNNNNNNNANATAGSMSTSTSAE